MTQPRQICDAQELSACMDTVDRLARLALEARRAGREFWLWRPSSELEALIEEMGLTEVLRAVF